MLVEQQVAACNHAVSHVMKPGGQLIPQDATIYIVPVESQLMVDRFSVSNLRFPKVVQTVGPEASRDMADAIALRKIDFTEHSADSAIDKVLNFRIVCDGTIHGLVGLFESKLYRDITLTMEDGWKQLFLPLDSPIKVDTGDEFSVRISYTPSKYNSLVVETR
jgi:hypothetical protein